MNDGLHVCITTYCKPLLSRDINLICSPHLPPTALLPSRLTHWLRGEKNIRIRFCASNHLTPHT